MTHDIDNGSMIIHYSYPPTLKKRLFKWDYDVINSTRVIKYGILLININYAQTNTMRTLAGNKYWSIRDLYRVFLRF